MTSRPLPSSSTEWLLNSQFAPHIDAFTHFLNARGHATITVNIYLGCLAHFARWTSRRSVNICQVNEDMVSSFLNEHLPACDCARPVIRNVVPLRAALGLFLVVLRANAVIPERAQGSTPVDEELRKFDDHLNHARGLVPKTRSMHIRIVGRLLNKQFADRPVDISTIKPDDVRQFFARQSELYSTPGASVHWPQHCGSTSVIGPRGATKCTVLLAWCVIQPIGNLPHFQRHSATMRWLV